jgi:hypothetical protein
MLVLFRCFLGLFLGLDVPQAERLTDLKAWRNPIAQVRAVAEGRLEDFSTQRRVGVEGKNPGKRPFNAETQRRKG